MDLTVRLPLEMKGAVLAHLYRHEMIRVSEVSRVWQQATRIDPRFYLVASAVIDPKRAVDAESSLLELPEIVEHAMNYDLALHLSFEVQNYRGDISELDDISGINAWIQGARAGLLVFCNSMDRAWPRVRHLRFALPRLLLGPLVDEHLRDRPGPASLLSLHFNSQCGPPMVSTPVEARMPITPTIFAGHAPALRILRFYGTPLKNAPITAFRTCRKLLITLNLRRELDPISLSTIVPNVRFFSIEVPWYSVDYGPPLTAPPIDISGSQLQILDIHENDGYIPFTTTIPPAVLHSIPLIRLHHFRFTSSFATAMMNQLDALHRFFSTTWDAGSNSGPLEVRLTHTFTYTPLRNFDGVLVAARNVRSGQRRVDVERAPHFDVQNIVDAMFDLAASRIVHITIDLPFLYRLLKLGRELSALECVELELRHRSDWIDWDVRPLPGTPFRLDADDEESSPEKGDENVEGAEATCEEELVESDSDDTDDENAEDEERQPSTFPALKHVAIWAGSPEPRFVRAKIVLRLARAFGLPMCGAQLELNGIDIDIARVRKALPDTILNEERWIGWSRYELDELCGGLIDQSENQVRHSR